MIVYERKSFCSDSVLHQFSLDSTILSTKNVNLHVFLGTAFLVYKSSYMMLILFYKYVTRTNISEL